MKSPKQNCTPDDPDNHCYLNSQEEKYTEIVNRNWGALCASASASVCSAATGSPGHERGHWKRQIEFMLSCIGYSVGLGNLWRFPYLCLNNGGGAFLVPYLLYLMICGMSLFFMETAIGQSTGLSTIRIFNMIPFFKGLGWCMVSASAIVSIYYNVIIAYTLYYLGMSFNWVLPWSNCENGWNTDRCFADTTNRNSMNTSEIFGYANETTISNRTRRSSAEEFWLFNVLELSPDIETLGGIQWKLFGALVGSWVITFVCMCRGIRSAGKIVYVTATLPYVFLTVIFIRGCTLPGAWNGLKFYIVPSWDSLMSIQVWIAAATQIFYSLGPAWGGLVTFASYNQYSHNVLRDAIVIPLICGFTSIYGGFAIYSVLGHQMYLNNVTDITQLKAEGPGLAFVVYPQALTLLPGAAIWSVLFFVTLLTLGVDSQFATLEAVITGLADQFPVTVGHHKVLLTLAVCVLEFLLGLLLTTRAGFYYFMLFDSYATSFSILVIGFIEVLVIAYLYGSRRLLKDVEGMLGPLKKLTRLWWAFSWWVLVPAMTLVIIVNTIIVHITGEPQFPTWAIVLGWCIASFSLMHLPIMAVAAMFQHGFNWRKLFSPDEEWGFHVDERRRAEQSKEAQ